MNCAICLEKYNYNKNKPYSLYPCGHTFCNECLQQINTKKCSKCRKVTVFKQINYAILETLDELLNRETSVDSINNDLDRIDFYNQFIMRRARHYEKIQTEERKKFFLDLENFVDESKTSLEHQKQKLTDDAHLISRSLTIKLDKLKSQEKDINSKIDFIKNRLNSSNEESLNLTEIYNELKSIELCLDIKNVDSVYLKFEQEIDSLEFINQINMKNVQVELAMINELAEIYYKEANELYFDARQRFRSFDLVDKVIALKPNDCAKAYFLKGRLFYALDKYNEAIKYFDKSIKLDPNCIISYNFKADTFISQLNEIEARNSAQIAFYLNTNPKNAFEYMNKAYSFSLLNQNEEAIQHIDKAIELDPENGYYYYLKSFDALLLNGYIESIILLDKTIELLPNFDKAYNCKGYDYYILGDFDKALEFFNLALDLNPNYYCAFRNKINLFQSLNKHDEIVSFVDNFIKANPDQINAYKFKIKALNELGKQADAVSFCIDIMNKDKSMSEIYKYCLIFLIDCGRYEEALNYCKKAFFLGFEDEFLYKLKLKCLLGLKNYEETLDVARRALSIYLNNSFSFKFEGQALLGLNKKSEAKEAFQQALQLTPNDKYLIQKINELEVEV